MTTITDMLQNLETTTNFSLTNALFSLFSALLIGMFIHFVYRKTFSGVMYSKPFNTSLVLLAILTTFVILAVTSNVVLSLGMVGALSIVRFRTAIKDPLDLVFLFWSIGVGIILGAGLYPLAYIGSLFITAVLLAFTVRKETESPYILMLDLENEQAEVSTEETLIRHFGNIRIKSKTLSDGQLEVIYEIKLKGSDTAFLNEINAVKGVKHSSLVSYNGAQAA